MVRDEGHVTRVEVEEVEGARQCVDAAVGAGAGMARTVCVADFGAKWWHASVCSHDLAKR